MVVPTCLIAEQSVPSNTISAGPMAHEGAFGGAFINDDTLESFMIHGFYLIVCCRRV